MKRRGERESESETGEVQGFKMKSRTEEEVEFNKMQYKTTKKETKKVVAVAKNNAYERLYQRFNAKGGENEIFKPARARERRTRDISSVRCIKDEDGRVLVEDAKVQELSLIHI